MTIFKVNILAKLKSIFWPSWGSPKKPKLAKILTLKFARVFFLCVETPIFIVFVRMIVFEKNKLGQNFDFGKGQTWPKY